MRLLSVLISTVILFSTCPVFSGPCASSPAITGYGSPGPYAVTIDSMPQSGLEKHTIYFYHPATAASQKLPVVFFLHGLGADNPVAYDRLLRHMAGRGYAVIYLPFRERRLRSEQVEEYHTMEGAAREAIKQYSAILDTSRIGIMGHSHGAGAAPFLTWKAIVDRGWGADGAFMYMMAPSYAFDIEPEQLDQFPPHVNMLMEVFEADSINDPRMAIDLYNAIQIPDSQKAYVTVRNDSASGCVFRADHLVPASLPDSVSPLAVYSVYRLFDALADYTFIGNVKARSAVLGNGNPAQITMGTWPNGKSAKTLLVSRRPVVRASQQLYANFWEKPINPRKNMSLSFVDQIGKGRFYFVKKSLRHYYSSVRERFGRKLEVRQGLAEEVCTIHPIPEGLGAQGKYPMLMDSIPLAAWPGHYVHVFLPDSAPGKRPVILFSHGYTSGKPEYYLPLLSHIVSRGYIVVFSTFDMLQIEKQETRKYNYLLTGFESACNLYRKSIDTTRVGFIGHSFGGGATPYVAAEYLGRKQWGNGGSFMHIMAPWYSFGMADSDFKAFPAKSLLLVMQVFHDDKVNDHRMAIDLFKKLPVPDSAKNYLLMFSDSNSVCRLIAHHRAPGGIGLSDNEENALDYYGVWRVFDALAAASFDKDTSARALVLGQGPETTYMGVWPDGRLVVPMLATTKPEPDRPENYSIFSWSNIRNPRRDSEPGFILRR